MILEIYIKGSRKGEKLSMNNYPKTKPGKAKVQQFVAGILLMSWLVLGNVSIGVASTASSMLKIQGDRITGILKQVPLRTVLNQLQEELAIKYVVSHEELDKPVSGNFTGELVTKSLTKILASWDYALQVNQKGRVQQIFVVAKVGPMEFEKNKENALKSPMTVFPKNITTRQPIQTKSNPQALLFRTEVTSNVEVDSQAGAIMVSAMPMESSEDLPPMITQSVQGQKMSFQPSANFMQTIPASAFAPMDVFPVSEVAPMEFIGG